MKFNINETVKVRLTDFGRRIDKESHEAVWNSLKYPAPPYIPPVEDAEGYSSWQLWDLMAVFGAFVFISGDLPFETEILLPPFADEPIVVREGV